MLTTALSLGLSFLPQGPSPSRDGVVLPADRILRVVPIHELTASPTFGTFRRSMIPFKSLLGLGGEEGNALLDSMSFEDGRMAADQVVELLRLRNAKLYEDEHFTLRAGAGGVLVVSGRTDAVRQIVADTQAIASSTATSLRITVTLYRATETPSPAFVDREGLATSTKDLVKLWQGSSIERAGWRFDLGQERRTRYVHSSGAEVAQSSKISDPYPDELFEGIRVGIVPYVLAETNDLVLFGQLAIGEQRQPLRTQQSGAPDSPSIDVPDVGSVTCSFSGRVTDGGALLISATGSGGPGVVVAVTAERWPREAAPTGGLIPVGALLTEARFGEAESVGGNRMSKSAGDFAFGPADREDLLRLIEESLQLGDRNVVLRCFGHWLSVTGPADAIEAASNEIRALLRGLQDQWVRNGTVDAVTTLEVDPTGGSGMLGVRQSTPSSGVQHRIRLPILAGRPHGLRRGYETTAVVDYDVEIAQKSTIAVPIVETLFSGIELRASVHAGARRPIADVQIDLREMPAPDTRPRETQEGTQLQLPKTAGTTFQHRGPVAPGQDVELGEGVSLQIDGVRYRTRQTVRVQLDGP